jgi:hypothetical protein
LIAPKYDLADEQFVPVKKAYIDSANSSIQISE